MFVFGSKGVKRPIKAVTFWGALVVELRTLKRQYSEQALSHPLPQPTHEKNHAGLMVGRRTHRRRYSKQVLGLRHQFPVRFECWVWF